VRPPATNGCDHAWCIVRLGPCSAVALLVVHIVRHERMCTRPQLSPRRRAESERETPIPSAAPIMLEQKIEAILCPYRTAKCEKRAHLWLARLFFHFLRTGLARPCAYLL
jgi:hypothetical protein